MSVENNKTIARGYIEQVWNQKRLDLLDQYLAEDIVHHDAPGLTDRESIRNFIGTFLNSFPDTHIKIEDEIAKGNLVVHRVTSSGTQRGEFMGIPASGKQISVTTISIFRISGGKISELWGVSDSLTMMQQIGAIPAPAASQQ
jgi:steroid delta-isomerase-like uncharacterized protein